MVGPEATAACAVDSLVPLAAAEAALSRMPDAKLILRPGDSHLGDFARVVEVLEFIRAFL